LDRGNQAFEKTEKSVDEANYCDSGHVIMKRLQGQVKESVEPCRSRLQQVQRG
jgi:hypothetical protein